MEHIISSFDVFEDIFSGTALMSNPKRIDALKKYFSQGGVIKLHGAKEAVPKLAYPNTTTLNIQLKRLLAQRQDFEVQRREWNGRLSSARLYFVKQNVMKLKEPLYWQHLAKYASDPDYKRDAETVKLPAHLVADKRWKPMVKMFVNDLDYRKQLAETVSTSIVYKNDRKVAQYASTLQDFRSGIAEKKLEFLNKKIAELDGRIATLHAMLAWARE